MSMYGAYPKVVDSKTGKLVEQKAWPVTDFTGDKGFTVQADRDDADINKIIARFHKSGQLPPMRGGQPFYGDVSDIGDLQDSLMKVQEANELFMAYPAELRERFDNDPVNLVNFLADEGNRKEAEELGLVLPRPKPAAPAEAPVAPAPAPSTPV